jgi:hypothetical protein
MRGNEQTQKTMIAGGTQYALAQHTAKWAAGETGGWKEELGEEGWGESEGIDGKLKGAFFSLFLSRLDLP